MAYVQLYPSHEHREDYPVTPDSIERAKEATRQERIRAGLDPDTGKFPTVTHQPLRQWPPLSQRVNCADALDRLIEKHGLRTVMLAIANVCACNGFDVCVQTIQDVAQGVER